MKAKMKQPTVDPRRVEIAAQVLAALVATGVRLYQHEGRDYIVSPHPDKAAVSALAYADALLAQAGPVPR